MEDLDRWVAELRADGDARARARRSWLARQAEEEATLVGVLIDLAERGRPVVVEVRTGRRHRGVIHGVGRDVVALRTSQGVDVLVALRALTAVRLQPGEPAPVGSRTCEDGSTLATTLAALAPLGLRVAMWCEGTEPLSGRLQAAGRDVARVVLDGDAGVAYVAVPSLDEVSVTESG